MRSDALLLVIACWLVSSCLAAKFEDAANTAESVRQSASSRGLFSWRRKFQGTSADSIGTNSTLDSISAGSDGGREGKFFSLFTVVRFPNDDCITNTKDNGTCFSASECSSRGGTASGTCASGFGVCCFFSYTCGQTTAQNNSYFANSGYPSSFDGTGTCQLSINKVSSDVCQLRLDFDTMVLSQPETVDNTCNRDQFLVTGGNRVPSICGTNSGQHMYIETGLAGNTPIILTVVTSGTGFARQWRIKVSQISCSSSTRVDNSCLQYFTGVTGTIQSFNYDSTNGRQLSNQDYTICIRTETNFCSISYSVCTGGVFSLTGPTGGSATNAGTPVGALVTAASCNTDWLTIPCSSDNGRAIQSGNTVCQDRLCGDAFSSTVRANSTTVISNVRPFRVAVHFDNFEATVPTGGVVTGTTAQFNNRGFCLTYVQQPCTA